MEVRACGVGVRFGSQPWLFGGVDLDLGRGDLVGVVGPSGSGKSTLLSVLAREFVPTRGTVAYDDVGTVAWVFQNPYGVKHRTALDHVTLPLIARGATRPEADAQGLALLGRFGLAAVAGQPFSLLSGGEAQRLQLARAVAAAPDLLLVDEPTAQLDARTAGEVNAVLGELADSGAAVVIATHDPRTAATCPRVLDLLDHPMGDDDAGT
ncbi:MAG: ATP-binding cassette domain-containing protein [Actinobacteria bacterium]|nr:ATP-binding cassette domain-containing protein [Actinomycetota bacterium]